MNKSDMKFYGGIALGIIGAGLFCLATFSWGIIILSIIGAIAYLSGLFLIKYGKLKAKG